MISDQTTLISIEDLIVPLVSCPYKGITYHYQVGNIGIDALYAHTCQLFAQRIGDQADLFGCAIDVANGKLGAISALLRLSYCQPVQAIPAAQDINLLRAQFSFQ